MTIKLFRQNPYMFHNEATVMSVMGPEVVLDKSIFFAFAGGQESDSGSIGGINVREATVAGENIVYILAEVPKFEEADTVQVVVDKEKRMKIMRLHSAAHIVYAIFKDMTGEQKLIGSNVYSEKSRIDYARDEPLTEVILKLQKKVDEFLSAPHEIKTYPDEKQPDRWWWECEGWKMPCGGTHVKNTSEIGKLVLKRKNLGKGKERIEITLG